MATAQASITDAAEYAAAARTKALVRRPGRSRRESLALLGYHALMFSMGGVCIAAQHHRFIALGNFALFCCCVLHAAVTSAFIVGRLRKRPGRQSPPPS